MKIIFGTFQSNGQFIYYINTSETSGTQELQNMQNENAEREW